MAYDKNGNFIDRVPGLSAERIAARRVVPTMGQITLARRYWAIGVRMDNPMDSLNAMLRAMRVWPEIINSAE